MHPVRRRLDDKHRVKAFLAFWITPALVGVLRAAMSEPSHFVPTTLIMFVVVVITLLPALAFVPPLLLCRRILPASAPRLYILSGFLGLVSFAALYVGARLVDWPTGLFLAIATALLLGFATLPIRRRRALIRAAPNPGCCEFCGYDLRSSNQRCPECGNPVPPGHIAQMLIDTPTSDTRP